jgi:hypothetical protein
MRRVTAGRRRLLALGIGIPLVGLGVAAVLPRLGTSTPAEAQPAPRFVEEAAAAGLEHRYDGEFMFFVGGGVAIFDCNGDGREDLYIAGGEEPAALFRNESAVGGALAFTRVPSTETDVSQVVGAYPIDIDADGIDDLAVLRLGENVLLRGLGDCTFERANETWAYEGGSDWTTAFSATWESDATLPTLAFGNYIEPDSVEERTYICAEHELIRPAADGTSYAPPTSLAPGMCTLSMLFSDWDRSGRRDLRLSNDRHYSPVAQEQLWRMETGEEPRAWTREEGWQTVRIWGMGITSHDLTGDGYPEVYLTSQADNKLQTLADGPERPTYEDIAIRSNANANKPYTGDTELLSTAWHPEFDDVNNDGFVDLFVSKGNVEAQPDYAARDPNNLLIGQPDGTFVEGGMDAGIARFERGRGAGLADLNLDGLLDLVVVNRRANVSLWRNVGAGSAESPEPMGNWTALRLADDGANRDGIGAWIEVTAGDRALTREVTIGGGHAGGQLGWIHFGIGDADRATLKVIWPDGETGPAMDVEANTFSILERGAAEPDRWQPAGG